MKVLPRICLEGLRKTIKAYSSDIKSQQSPKPDTYQTQFRNKIICPDLFSESPGIAYSLLRVQVSIPDKDTRFFSSPKQADKLWVSEHEADHSPPFNAKVNNERSCNSTPPMYYHGMQSDNHTSHSVNHCSPQEAFQLDSVLRHDCYCL
jgi:hypothetical protein